MREKLLILLGVVVLWGCKPMELKQVEGLNRQVTLHGPDVLIKAHLQKEGMLILPKIENTYYWFEKGKISSSQGAYSGKVLHGQYRVFGQYQKQLVESGKFYKGLKNGRWLYWSATGLLSRSEIYKNGRLNGILVKYDSLGMPLDTFTYRNGQLRPEKVALRSDSTGLFKRVKRFLGFKK